MRVTAGGVRDFNNSSWAASNLTAALHSPRGGRSYRYSSSRERGQSDFSRRDRDRSA